ncbi:MAG: polysaccharide biosynthesis tyrosine autokinase [Chitinophagaceae bacterium]
MQNSTKPPDTTQNGGIAQIISRYISYWPLFAGLLILGIASAWIYLRYTIPVYESSATILLKDDTKGMDNSEMMASLNLFGSKKIVENEIEVLRSRTLMKDVVKNLGLYAPIYMDGKINVLSAYVLSPVRIFLKNPDSLIQQDKVYFSYDEGTKRVVIKDQQYPVNQWVSSPYGQIKFTPNKEYREIADKKSFFFYLVNVKAMANGYLSLLDVSPASKLATVVTLRTYDEVPERGEDILDELITVYNSSAINDKNKLAANALSFVEDRLHFVVAELDSVETVIQKYKSDKGIVDISEQGKLFLQSVEINDQKVSDISVQLSILEQIEKYVRDKDQKSGIVPSTGGLSDAVLPQLLEKLYNTEIQYERLKRTTAENNPILISLQDQIEKIKPGILENIRNQRNNLEAGKANLASTSGRYSSMLRAIPQKERELLEISRQQSIKNNIYTFLLQKREEAALSFASTVPDSRLVDNAESYKNPVSPKSNLVYGIACLLALSIPVGFVSLKELINKKIFFRSEIGDILSFPVIGEIAQDASKNAIVIGDGERSFIAEQFRQIRTSLSYLGLGSGKKKILVTSSISGEGKSFITSNLAVSLALTEKKVIMVELDLRKPQLGKIFNDTNKFGISDFLKGKATKEKVISRTSVNPHLYLISAGTEVINPSELLLNGKLQELLSYLETTYDFILMESGPVNAVTDSFIISNLCDATLFVIRHNYTSREQLMILKDHLKVRELNNPGIIFNGLKSVGFSKYGSEYGYVESKGKKKQVV